DAHFMTGFGSAIASFCEDMGSFLINSIVRIYTLSVTAGYKRLRVHPAKPEPTCGIICFSVQD
ncbi:MAG: hypothetical protein P8O08_09330, partial [Paracoccaceae bacterium]|nr:hypothetical protein [Paracoccaceae bacterium]